MAATYRTLSFERVKLDDFDSDLAIGRVYDTTAAMPSFAGNHAALGAATSEENLTYQMKTLPQDLEQYLTGLRDSSSHLRSAVNRGVRYV